MSATGSLHCNLDGQHDPDCTEALYAAPKTVCQRFNIMIEAWKKVLGYFDTIRKTKDVQIA